MLRRTPGSVVAWGRIGRDAMPTHLAGRVALGIGTAAVLVILVIAVVPPAMQVLAAIFSLPIGASILAYAHPAPRTRTAQSTRLAKPTVGSSWTVSTAGMDQPGRVHPIRPIPPPVAS